MRKFISKTIIFISIFISILVFILIAGVFIIPPTPRASTSLLFSKVKKDSLLKNAESPRIIFIGGSNLSFGLNSEIIKDSLGINPINTGIHAALGLVYMLDSTLPYITAGDIVIICPEYEHFYGRFAYGGEELLRTILDVSPSELGILRKEQLRNILPFFQKYFFSKFSSIEYFNIEKSELYGVDSFNEFGDVYTHWKLPKYSFEPFNQISGPFNYAVVNELRVFNNRLLKKGALMFVTFPALQAASYDNSREQIMRIETELRKNDLPLLGSPERYKMADSFMFNTPYHLSKAGVDYRTKLLIEDINKSIHQR